MLNILEHILIVFVQPINFPYLKKKIVLTDEQQRDHQADYRKIFMMYILLYSPLPHGLFSILDVSLLCTDIVGSKQPIIFLWFP